MTDIEFFYKQVVATPDVRHLIFCSIYLRNPKFPLKIWLIYLMYLKKSSLKTVSKEKHGQSLGGNGWGHQVLCFPVPVPSPGKCKGVGTSTIKAYLGPDSNLHSLRLEPV